jgi:hypothetical protein
MNQLRKNASEPARGGRGADGCSDNFDTSHSESGADPTRVGYAVWIFRRASFSAARCRAGPMVSIARHFLESCG